MHAGSSRDSGDTGTTVLPRPANTDRDKPRRTSPANAIVPGTGTVDREFRQSEVFRQAKRLLILLVGGTILIAGVALLVLPGPAIVVIPVGLSILSIEFAWARRWLRRARSIWESSGKESSDRPPGNIAEHSNKNAKEPES